ncbi:MAG TPA: hypothetical protein VGI81_27950 [Tepidisphaeraceae bacterium]
MVRRVGTIASVVSLLLCGAAAALWTATQFWYFGLHYRSGRWWGADVIASEGTVRVIYDRFTPPVLPPFRRMTRRGPLTPTPPTTDTPRLDVKITSRVPIRWIWRGQKPVIDLPCLALVPEQQESSRYYDGVGARAGSAQFYWLWVRLWPSTVLLAILSTFRAHAYVRRRRQMTRQRAGLCASCGYDLRASTGRCPECGTAIAMEAKA